MTQMTMTMEDERNRFERMWLGEREAHNLWFKIAFDRAADLEAARSELARERKKVEQLEFRLRECEELRQAVINSFSDDPGHEPGEQDHDDDLDHGYDTDPDDRQYDDCDVEPSDYEVDHDGDY